MGEGRGIAGANEGLVGFYPRSIEYDFTSFLIESPKIQVLLNDGYNWVRRNRQALAFRLASPTHVTQFCLLDPDGPLIDFVAQKSRKKIAEQRKDIYDFCEAVQKIADDAGNQNLEIRFHSGLNTHSLFLNETHVVVTPYFTSVNRFPYLPLLKFKSGTVTYANYLLDFELMFRAGRPYLNSAAARAS